MITSRQLVQLYSISCHRVLPGSDKRITTAATHRAAVLPWEILEIEEE